MKSEIHLCIFPLYCVVLCPNMHVTGMDHVDRNRGDNEAMHASVMRDREER